MRKPTPIISDDASNLSLDAYIHHFEVTKGKWYTNQEATRFKKFNQLLQTALKDLTYCAAYTKNRSIQESLEQEIQQLLYIKHNLNTDLSVNIHEMLIELQNVQMDLKDIAEVLHVTRDEDGMSNLKKALRELHYCESSL